MAHSHERSMACMVPPLCPQLSCSRGGILRETAPVVGRTDLPVMTFAVANDETCPAHRLDVHFSCPRSSLCCWKNSITKSSCCLANKRPKPAKSQISARVVILASSLRGRFPETPVHLPANPPAWLQVARQQMRSAGKVEEFRKKVEKEWAEKGDNAASCPFKTLEERMAGIEFRTEDSDPWFLMELSIHCIYSKAYELEAEGLGFCPTGITSVFSVPQGHQISALAELWSFQSGLRFVMEPLVVAEGPDELIACITDLQLKTNLEHFCLSHEKLAPSTNRTCRKELRAQVGVAIGDIESCRFGTEWAPDRPRFAIIEIATGYIFGHVIYAPGPQLPSYRFAPHRWSAGIPTVLASIAVNIAGSAGDKLVDPCCGLGTILFEANRRGLTAEGSDLSLGTLVNTARNFDHFKVPYSRSWGEFCSIFGPHNPRTKTPSASTASLCAEVSSLIASPDASTTQPNSSAKMLPVSTIMVSGLPEAEGAAGQNEISTALTTDREPGPEYRINNLEENGWDLMLSLSHHPDQSQSTGYGSSLPTCSVVAETGTISLAVKDARTLDFEADCVVSNLPFGRFLTLEEGSIDSILRNLKGRARRYVFFFGSPLSSLLTLAGYHVVREISVCPRNKRFMAICTC